MSLPTTGIPRLFALRHSPISPRFLTRMVGARQRHCCRNVPYQAFSSGPSTTTSPIYPREIEKYTRSPAQFPPISRLLPDIPDRSPWLSLGESIPLDLYEDGLRAWGFVIYRCTYQSNTAWVEFMRRFLANTKDTLESNGALDLLDNLALTVIEDSESLDGATTARIRRHFQQWATTAMQEEPDTISPRVQLSQRYNYCLQITQDALDSVLASEVEGGFVRLIRKDWEEYDPYDHRERMEEEQEAIEGCTFEDVGWMNVPFDGVMFDPWYYLRDGCWGHNYRRPPRVAFALFE